MAREKGPNAYVGALFVADFMTTVTAAIKAYWEAHSE